MKAQDSIFREEALKHHVRREATGDLLRLGDRNTKWGFRILLAGMLASVILGSRVRVDQKATGQGWWDPSRQRLVALLPQKWAHQLESGLIMTFVSDATKSVFTVQSVSIESKGVVRVIADPDWTAVLPDEPILGRAEVVVGSTPLIVSLIPGLEAILGRG